MLHFETQTLMGEWIQRTKWLDALFKEMLAVWHATSIKRMLAAAAETLMYLHCTAWCYAVIVPLLDSQKRAVGML